MFAKHGYVALASQVAGHPGVMTSEDGSLVIKPALPVEVSIYQRALSDPAFTHLLPHIPEFYGTLRLEGRVDPDKSVGGPIVVAEDSASTLKEADRDECAHYVPIAAAGCLSIGCLHIPSF